METNYEHYKQDIDGFINGSVRSFGLHKTDYEIGSCLSLNCGDCLFSNVNNDDDSNCNARTIKWLVSEYKDPAENVDWSKVPVDTPVLVRETQDDEWHNRYFAYFKDGNVYTFANGVTSWSDQGSRAVTQWSYTKLANPKDCKSAFHQEEKELTKEERMEQLSAIYKDSCVKSAWKEMIEAVDKFWQSDIDDNKKDTIANMVMTLLRMER